MGYLSPQFTNVVLVVLRYIHSFFDGPPFEGWKLILFPLSVM